MDLQNTTIRIDIPDEQPLVIDLAEVYALEARKAELATVGKATASSLLRAMEDGYSKSGSMLALVAHKETVISLAITRRRAYIKLDVIPKTLQEKGLATARSPAGSEDLREAVMSMDSVLQNLENVQAQLQALKEMLKVKVQGFQMTFSGVKKVIDDSSSAFGYTPPASTAPRY